MYKRAFVKHIIQSLKESLQFKSLKKKSSQFSWNVKKEFHLWLWFSQICSLYLICWRLWLTKVGQSLWSYQATSWVLQELILSSTSVEMKLPIAGNCFTAGRFAGIFKIHMYPFICLLHSKYLLQCFKDVITYVTTYLWLFLGLLQKKGDCLFVRV